MALPTTATLQEQAVTFPGPQGALAGRMIRVAQPRLAVVIAAATGVPAAYYAAFARWLAVERQAAVLIFDYSDFAPPPPGREAARAQIRQVRTSAADMRQWGVDEAGAARAFLRQSFPDLPLWHIGHSLGAVAFPFQSNPAQVARFIAVCAGPVHWREHPWPMRGMAFALWHLMGPVSTAVLGYFPGHRFGLGGPMPPGVFRQWRRWCTTTGAGAADPAMPGLQTLDFRAPVTLIAAADDALMPPEAAWRMAAWLPKAEITRRLLVPAEHGLGAIGHVAAFAPRNQVLWPQLIA